MRGLARPSGAASIGGVDASAHGRDPIGLYVHIPFCRTKCTYCDFTAFAGLGHRADAYLDALEREAEVRASRVARPVATVFFGGGTPSELTPAQLRRCLRFVLGSLSATGGDRRRSAGACPPPRSPGHGGGQAPALRSCGSPSASSPPIPPSSAGPAGHPERSEGSPASPPRRPLSTIGRGPRAWEILRCAQDDKEAFGACRGIAPQPLSVELEANPESLDPERLDVLREGGVTRLSIGVQSFEDAELRAIARFHGARGAIEAYQAARRWGFGSVSLDLMLGIPGQTVESWRRSLDVAVALAPDHISAYGLTLEPATPLARQVRRGRVTVPDDDEQASMYALACELLAGTGYRHYEVSNWARPGHESAHNQGYWRGRDYLGLGAGATSTVAGLRWTNHRSLERYIASASERGVAEGEIATLSADEVRSEMVMLGLRTADGISRAELERRFGLPIEAWGGDRLQELAGAGLVRWTGDSLVVPEDRWFVLHAIVASLLAEG